MRGLFMEEFLRKTRPMVAFLLEISRLKMKMKTN